jgi:hypothetical protein
VSDTRAVSQGLGFTEALLLVFVVLKLIGVINWSWWWVLAPLWIPLSLVVVGFVIYAGYHFATR